MILSLVRLTKNVDHLNFINDNLIPKCNALNYNPPVLSPKVLCLTQNAK